MVRIKIIQGGCGIEYKDANGTARHTLKTPESGPFECDEAQAERLVGLRVAIYVDEPQRELPEVSQIVEDTPLEEKEQNVTDEEPEEMTYAEQLEGMTYNELKKLAADTGVKPAGNKKADYVAALVAAEEEIDDEDDGDELPELSAVDPE